MESFPSIHSHTYFSLLDGLPKPAHYFERCQEIGMKHIAFTDHGSLGSLAEATIDARNFDVTPIMGLEAYLINSIRKLNEKRKEENITKEKLKPYRKAFHILFLAKNEEGYNNLIKLNNYAWLDGFYYKPNIDFESLRWHNEGLVCTSACMGGIISQFLISGRRKTAVKIAKRMKGLFGDDFYIELQLIGMDEQDKLNKELISLGNQLKIPFVVTNDAHFVRKGGHLVQMMLREMALDESAVYEAPENYLKSLKEWEDYRDERPSIPKKVFHSAVDNCFKIADQCNYTVPLGNLYFPKFDHKTHFLYEKFPLKNKWDFFKHMIVYRARKLLGARAKKKVYVERLTYEANTLRNLGALDYFLICDDLLHYVRSHGAFSLIRGSANGSLIAFVCGFGLIDPIKHDIMFERFISKYRSLNDVDIDIDVRSEFRSKAIAYLRKKYGEDRVLSVGTYNRMQLKGAVKDVSRIIKKRIQTEAVGASVEDQKLINVKQRPYNFPAVNKITSNLPADLGLEKARELSEEFDEWCKKTEPEGAVGFIEPLVGTLRNASLHPAGVVITPGKIDDLLPIRTQANPANKSQRVASTVWENSHTSREDLNEIGLMVLDVLGVKTLSVVSEVLDLVEKRTGKKIDIYDLDLDDKLTLKTFNKGETLGVFQFSGGSTKKIVKRVNITEFNDLIVINAISRPGALTAGADESFAKRKKNSSLIRYDHHSLENILDDSLGVLVFSEHILKTASEFAGMHPKKADALRKIIKGKNPTVFKSYEKEFISGAMKKWSHEPDIQKVANRIWKKFSQAGGYLFPRGHASSYALLGYICQYLKVHYPVEFFACHFRYLSQDKYAEAKAVAETYYKIKFVMPRISDPRLTFEPGTLKEEEKTVYWPITGIKHIGSKAAQAIMEEAKKVPFSSLKNFYDRIDRRVCNVRVVENLILAGLLDDFARTRREVLEEYYHISGKAGGKNKREVPEAFSSKEKMRLAADDLFGFEVTPLEKIYAKKLEKFGPFHTYEDFERLRVRHPVRMFGRLHVVRKLDKPWGKMAFLNFNSQNREVKIVLFDQALKAFSNLGIKFLVGDVIVVSGKKNYNNNQYSIIVDTQRGIGTYKLKPGHWIQKI